MYKRRVNHERKRIYITKEEWKILEDNGIDWCPDNMFGMNQDAIIFEEDEYGKAMELLGRK